MDESASPAIYDKFGRTFPYVRISITDVCNFRCSYCLPNGYKKTGSNDFMNLDEIVRLVRALAELGVWKIRLTGGEPTVRKDFNNIAQHISEIPGIRCLAFTTNGYQLEEHASTWRKAGLQKVNISIDSLKRDTFLSVTGHDMLHKVLRGLDRCLEYGFKSVKINTVLLKEVNDNELDDFIDLVRDKDISLRFIELMKTCSNHEYFSKYHLPTSGIKNSLIKRGWVECDRQDGDGPAVELYQPGTSGKIGLIAPYSKDFCTTCNRLRISAKGNLHLCLFGEGGYSLRQFMQSDDQKVELKNTILRLMKFKLESHKLHQNLSGSTQHFASIGG